MAIAVGHIESVLHCIEDTLNPQGSLKEEVKALHEVYQNRKNILLEIDAKHTALRHQKLLVAREGAARRVRIPKTVRSSASIPNMEVMTADDDMGVGNIREVDAAATEPTSDVADSSNTVGASPAALADHMEL